MHETAMAQSLVEVISEEARSRRAKPIRAKMSCGMLNTVNDDVIAFAFEALARGTPCEGMQLQIEHKPLQARCRACGRVFAVDMASVKCPECGADDFELLPDAPLLLEQIEFEEGADDGEGERGQEDPGCQ
ncbi:MAG: hydrogenase maturation nickel metallochaperone HypA [Sedimentisphaerales bacterium]|nr:hydrogenase maturation nickel metallochaperone HypA [Sedimentisphaerales bacterium]